MTIKLIISIFLFYILSSCGTILQRQATKNYKDPICKTKTYKVLNSKQQDFLYLKIICEFIETSKQKNPSGHYSVENMIQFDLGKQYDVIICLFSSIGYLQTVDEIVSALKCFNKHLKPNGLLIVEPWFNKDSWHKGKVHMLASDKEDIKICRMNRSYLSGDFSILNFHYLVGTMDNGVQHFQEEHKLRLTSKEEMFNAFKLADLDVTFDEKGLIGRGMYYGNKKTLA